MNKKPQQIAIDIGYGDTKVAFGDNVFKFPTAIARKKESYTELDDAASDDVYEYNGREFIVGERAISEALTTRGIKFLIDYGPLIIYVACVKAGIDFSKQVQLATGLSIKNWNDRTLFTDEIIKYSKEKDHLKLSEIFLYAQGQGILRDSGVQGNNIVVIDIGYNTLDFLYFEKGKPNKEESFATDAGVNKVISRLQAAIGKTHNIRFTEQMTKQIQLTGVFKIKGETKDYNSKIKEFLADYSQDTIGELENSKKSLIDMADKVIVSGGGANFIVRESLSSHYVFSAKPFEFSNVRGYLKLMRGE